MSAVIKISLSQNKFALIDAKDWHRVRAHKWHACKYRHSWYAKRTVTKSNGQRTSVFMHRVIAGAKRGQLIDHKNGNGLNNRRKNLRSTTPSKSGLNRHRSMGKSGHVGVIYQDDCPLRPWESRVFVKGKYVFLGHFATRIEAANARNRYVQRVLEDK